MNGYVALFCFQEEDILDLFQILVSDKNSDKNLFLCSLESQLCNFSVEYLDMATGYKHLHKSLDQIIYVD